MSKGFFDFSATKIYRFSREASILCLVSCMEPGRYAEILEDLKKDPESHGGPPDCIVS